MSEVKHYSGDMTAADMVERIDSPIPLIVECGCHDGRDTEKFLAAFPACRMVCFEPDPRPLFRHDPPGFFDRIPHCPQVQLVQAAVSDRDGFAILNRSSGDPPGACWAGVTDWDHSSSLFEPTGHLDKHAWCTFPEGHRLEVTTIQLDTYMLHIRAPQVHEIDLIWADVQGAEAAMIRGATNTLKRTRWLYTEFYDEPMYEGQPSLQEITALLPGWELVAIYAGYNALFRNKEFS